MWSYYLNLTKHIIYYFLLTARQEISRNISFRLDRECPALRQYRYCKSKNKISLQFGVNTFYRASRQVVKQNKDSNILPQIDFSTQQMFVNPSKPLPVLNPVASVVTRKLLLCYQNDETQFYLTTRNIYIAMNATKF